MTGIFPVAPVDAKQTNCWKLVWIVGLVAHGLDLLYIISIMGYAPAHKRTISGLLYALIKELINLALFVIYMYHTYYTRLSVTSDEIEITMGPWNWLGWFASSQIKRQEIVRIEVKERHWCLDIILHMYCLPLNWCCCHKSYSSYFWPYCCTEVRCCGLCDGDSSSSKMIQINLSESPCECCAMCCKRCAPFAPFAMFNCCVYNRIALSIKDETWIEQLALHGYPLNVGLYSNNTVNTNTIVQNYQPPVMTSTVKV